MILYSFIYLFIYIPPPSTIQNRVSNFLVHTTRHIKILHTIFLNFPSVSKYSLQLMNAWVGSVTTSTNIIVWCPTKSKKNVRSYSRRRSSQHGLTYIHCLKILDPTLGETSQNLVWFLPVPKNANPITMRFQRKPLYHTNFPSQSLTLHSFNYETKGIWAFSRPYHGWLDLPEPGIEKKNRKNSQQQITTRYESSHKLLQNFIHKKCIYVLKYAHLLSAIKVYSWRAKILLFLQIRYLLLQLVNFLGHITETIFPVVQTSTVCSFSSVSILDFCFT